MSIIYDKAHNLFHLKTKEFSYIMQVLDIGYLTHLYWGKSLNSYGTYHKAAHDKYVNLDVLSLEYAVYGTGDLRTPTLEVVQETGSTVSELKYIKHKIVKGKPSISPLPSTYVESDEEAETLIITLEDAAAGYQVNLTYTIYEEFHALTRSAQIVNCREDGTALKLQRALSICVDYDQSNYELLQLSGAWCREKYIYRRDLVPGLQAVDSKRGFSSHQQSPFIALTSKNCTEQVGEVYGFSLVYSGNFLAEVEVDQFQSARVQMGINPFDFTWTLNKGESFQTPEVVMVYSSRGLGLMSRIYHKLYRERLCRGLYRDEERPILINNWEATYFNFTEDKIEEIATTGKELGMELFVLDDGWFGKRDSDNCSLGDWVVDRKKLPKGLDALVNKITNKEIRFGLWFEPEMVSPDSDLYRTHPDWCLHVPERVPMSSPSQRNQLVLDLSRDDVCNKIIEMLSDILSSAPISYVKWDMNRSFSDMGSALLPKDRQREISHRYMLGLYHILEVITNKFPHVLFESCASGGGRYDPGMLYYMPQTWTSDDTDAIERLKIQYGTSLVYPAITMGSHISASPNHQVGRVTSLETRGNVAMAGNFGYELDLTKFSDEEKATVKDQVSFYKSIRRIVQFGDQYRLLNPFDGNETAWMYVTDDKKEAVVFYYSVLAKPNDIPNKFCLDGLNPEYSYQINDSDLILGGDELLYSGIIPPNSKGDFASCCFKLKSVDAKHL